MAVTPRQSAFPKAIYIRVACAMSKVSAQRRMRTVHRLFFQHPEPFWPV